MNLRDWLIIIGVAIITGILLDGFRRMRLAKKDSLQMSRDMGGEFENTPIDDFNPELPGGGARIVGDGSCEDAGAGEDAIESGVFKINPEAPLVSSKVEPKLPDDSVQTTTTNTKEEPLVADAQSRIEVESVAVKTAYAGKKSTKTVVNVEAADAGAEDTLCIVINVHAQTNHAFPGLEVKKLLEACGLDHGEMSIFHRHEEDDLLSPVQFSVANAIEPGYFDPDILGSISTPGVSFFMTLPGPKDYTKAFEYMLETAQCFARNLKGELKDEQLCILTPQTIEHNKQKIKDFERLQLAKSRA